MKRNWDVIRELLIEVEALDTDQRHRTAYGVGPLHAQEDQVEAEHALLLWKSGLISAVDVSSLEGEAIQSPELTWADHDLLDTVRSKPIWERIKRTASEKGVDLTFDAVKVPGKLALEWVAKS
jgi:uncharacterized protein DUF2513